MSFDPDENIGSSNEKALVSQQITYMKMAIYIIQSRIYYYFLFSLKYCEKVYIQYKNKHLYDALQFQLIKMHKKNGKSRYAVKCLICMKTRFLVSKQYMKKHRRICKGNNVKEKSDISKYGFRDATYTDEYGQMVNIAECRGCRFSLCDADEETLQKHQ